MDEFEGFPNAPFEDGFQWLQCTLWRWISMTAWAIVSIHNYERTETKSWDKLVQSKLFALNANVHSSSQPVTLAHRKDDCFMTSLAPWCNNSQLAGELNMTKNMDGLSWNFFCSHIAHSIFLWKPERKWENSFLFLSFAIDLYCLRMSNRKHKWEVNKSRAKTESVEYIYQGLITEKVNWQPLGCLVFSPI